MLKLSHSRLKLWRRCHKAYNYRYIQRIKRRVKGRALQLGSIIHDSVEAWLTGKNYKSVIRKYRKELDKVFVEERIELGLDDVIETAKCLMDSYTENYKDDNLEYTSIEQEFEVPLIPEKEIYFIGKTDAMVLDPKKRQWVFERKTCKNMPDEEVRMSDIQTVLYWWALPIQFPKFKPAGVIWDYVRTKAPAVPEKLKAGGLSKRKNIDTLRSVYLKAIKDQGLKIQDYADILNDLRGNEEKFFRRIRLPFSPGLRDQVLNETKQTAIEIHHLGEILTDRNLNYDCKNCDYYKLCQAELRGMDTEFLMKKEYLVGDDDGKKGKRQKR